jgi:hypothetical protein
MYNIKAVHNFADGRTLNLVQKTPRKFTVVLESKPTHEIDGIKFVQIIRSCSALGEKMAWAKFYEFAGMKQL